MNKITPSKEFFFDKEEKWEQVDPKFNGKFMALMIKLCLSRPSLKKEG